MKKMLTATLLALFVLATAMAQTTGTTRNRWQDNDGGWVIDENQPKNGNRCGCPAEALACDEEGSENWPTRCLAENINPSDRIYGACYFDRGEGEWLIMKYPQIKVPNGYPNQLGGHSAGVLIPFPGWPAEAPPNHSQRVSEWRGTLRKKYHARYEKKGTPPGHETQGYAEKTELAWGHAWQIHHILERKHNGTDTWGNMVPVYSVSGTNWHSKFTTFWQRVKVDSQFTLKEKTWSKIKNCSYTQWPKTEIQRNEIAHWSSGS